MIKELNSLATFSGEVSLSQYTHISSRHMASLDYMCKRLLEIENTNDYEKNFKAEHTALAHSVVILSTCLLESTINELFCDALHCPENLRELDTEKTNLLKRMWDLEIPKTARYSILEKYQIALTLLEKPNFNKGDAIYQNAQLLINLRNEIIHSEAEITTDDNDQSEKTKSSKLFRQLSAKFVVKKGTELLGNPFFPDKCFGYGCALWSSVSAVNLIKDFYRLAGLITRLEFITKVIENNDLSLFK